VRKSSGKTKAPEPAACAGRRFRRCAGSGVSAVALTLILAGCDRSAVADTRRLDASAVIDSTIWIGRSPGGATIQVRRESGQLEAEAAMRFEIAVGGARSDDAITADLVSPDMPSHGVTRYEAKRLRPGVHTIELAVPMEGRWELYVNLDDGLDAVAFPFDVAARAGSGQSQHATSRGGGAQQHPH
jgi:hypothetical protein